MQVLTVLKIATLLAFCIAGVKSQDTSDSSLEPVDDAGGCTIVITVTNTEELSDCEDDSGEADEYGDLVNVSNVEGSDSADSADEAEGQKEDTASGAMAGYSINKLQGSMLGGVLAAGVLVAAGIV
ncbi:hypothetical protein H4S06_005592 [Coemansia sp. BCRC 34490]|nr:hypothetical protein LPJ72_002386 [Coemansia sp. Benny D160-2]KAJ2743297.1 hypothetical protein H4S06_005592 [Coemansia sp. BCRC 34490]